MCGEQTTVDSRVCRIRFDPLFRLRHVFSSKMDSLAWLRYAQSALFSPLRGKMLTHFILPESLGFSERTPKVLTNLLCGRFVFCWEWGGDRSIGGANLRKGRQPLQWPARLVPPSMEVRLAPAEQLPKISAPCADMSESAQNPPTRNTPPRRSTPMCR